MKSKSNLFLRLSLCTTMTFLVSAAGAGTIQKANNTTNLNLPASWTGGVVPGANDVASWNSTVAAANSTLLGGNLTWNGISITNPGGPVTIAAGNTLTLGSSGIDMSAATQNLSISSWLTLAGSTGQSWHIATGTTLALGTGVFTRSAGATLIASGGAGTISTTNIANTLDIVGPWAAVNTSGAYNFATITAGNLVAYTAATQLTANTPFGGMPTGGTPTINYDLTSTATYATFGTARFANTVRYTGAGSRQPSNTLNGDLFTMNGFMNAGTGTFTFGTAGNVANDRPYNVLIGPNLDLVLAPMTAGITFLNPIKNNGANASRVTVMGNNTVTLSGVNLYTGVTTVTGGTLLVNSAGSINTSSGITINGIGAKYLHTSSVASTVPITVTRGTIDGTGTLGAVTVGAGTGGVVAHGNGTTGVLTLGTLTFSGAAAATVKIAGGTEVFAPAITVTGALATPGAAGAIVVNFTSPTSPLENGSTYNLIGYGSFTGSATDFVAANVGGLSPRQVVTFGDDTVNKFITATIAGDVPKWTGLDNSNWVVGTTGANKNWKLVTAGTATDYLEGDAVRFDDSVTGPAAVAVSISSANVAPTITTFANSTKNYTISSANNFGIAGSGTLIKGGSGKVTLTTINSYTGATTISEGILQLGDGTTDGSIASSNSITNDGSLVFRIIGTQTYTHAIGGAGTITKQDGGSLILSSANSYSGGTTVSGGSVTLNGPGSLGSGDFSLASGTVLNINSNLALFHTVTGSGTINNTGSTTVAGDFSGFSGTYTHNNALVSTAFNSATATSKDAAYVIASVQGSSQGMIAAGFDDYTLEMGSLNGVANSLLRGGNIATGLTTLQVGNLNGNDTFAGAINNGVTKTIAFTKVGTGTMTLSGVNTYTGNTAVNAGTLALADNGQLRFVIGANGVNNSISGTGSATFDGDFNLDLTAADPTTENSWTLVNVGTLTETFGSTFSLVGFTESANVHKKTVGTNTFSFTESTGTLTVAPATGYALWAGLNANNQAVNLDFDNDGTTNGAEYFMNAPAGFTANPALSGTNTVTWINGGNIPSTAYGTQFVVQTSQDLVNWTNVPAGSLTTNTSGPGGTLRYTLVDDQPEKFVRLAVMPE